MIIWNVLREDSDASPVTVISRKVILMKTIWNIIAVMLMLGGAIFFLQGINILPGSYMTGDPQWAINGSIMMVIALGLLFWANRRK